MKTSAKIFVLAITVLFVLTLVQGCNNSAATKDQKQSAKMDMSQTAKKPCPKAAQSLKSGKLSSDDIKKARLVSAENIELNAKVEKLQNDVNDLNTKLAKAQQESEKLKKTNEQSMEVMLSAMSEGVQNETAKLKEENKNLQTEIDGLKKQLKNLKAEPKK